MTIPPEAIKQIREEANLFELMAEDGIELKKSGTVQQCCCPFHDDKTASFTVYEESRFKCFGCGVQGDAIKWIQDHRGLPFVDAVKLLGAMQGIDVEKFMEKAEPKPRKHLSKAKKADPVVVTPAATDKKLEEGSEVYRYLTDERKIDPETLAHYKVAEGTVYQASDKTNWLAAVFLAKDSDGTLRNIKRVSVALGKNGKRIVGAQSGGEAMLIGKHVVGEATGEGELLIAEGEIDMLTWAGLGVSAVSIPFGAGNHQWIEHDFDWVRSFDKVLIAYDSDTAGQKGAAEVAERLGIDKCYMVQMPDGVKDANEALQNGMVAELAEACKNARPIMPDGLKAASDYIEEVEAIMRGEVEQGEPVFFTDNFKLRPHELTMWSGFSGHGKTTVLNQVIGDRLEAGERCCIASLEIRPKKTTHILARQRSKSSEPQPAELRNQWMENLWYFAHVGNKDWRNIIEVFEYAYRRFKITQFVIDSLLRCGIPSDDHTQQKQFLDALADFVEAFPVHVHLVAHSKKLEDESKFPDKLDVKGSGDMTDVTHNGFTVWRNKAKERALNDPTKGIDEQAEARTKADANILMWKQRETGEEPFSALGFDKESMLFARW